MFVAHKKFFRVFFQLHNFSKQCRATNFQTSRGSFTVEMMLYRSRTFTTASKMGPNPVATVGKSVCAGKPHRTVDESHRLSQNQLTNNSFKSELRCFSKMLLHYLFWVRKQFNPTKTFLLFCMTSFQKTFKILLDIYSSLSVAFNIFARNLTS